MASRIQIGGGAAPSLTLPWTISGTVELGDVVYQVSGADRTIARADADNASARPPIGVVTGIAGSTANVATNGQIAAGAVSIVAGTTCWLSTTPGQLVSTKPASNAYLVGVGVNTTDLLVGFTAADLADAGQAGGAGGITSVGISSSTLSVSNSPVTTSGTIDVQLTTAVGVAAGGTGLTTGGSAGNTLYAASESSYVFQDVTCTMRNRIMNGSMMIAQRGTAAVTAVSHNNVYPVDRWFIQNGTTTNITGQQSSVVPPGFVNSCQLATTTAVNSTGAQQILFQQRIEGYNVVDLAYGSASAKPMVLSFWVRSSVTGTYGGSAAVYPAANSNAYSYVFTYTINAANTWERKTVSISAFTAQTITNLTTGVGIYLSFDLGSPSGYETAANVWTQGDFKRTSSCVKWANNANASWYVTGVQLELGSVATPFEVRPMQAELMMCQRYYLAYRAFSNQTRVPFAVGSWASNLAQMGFIFPVPMRVTPTVVTVTNLAGNGWNVHGSLTYSSILGGNAESMVVSLSGSGYSVQTTLVTNDTDTGFIGFSAEL